MSTAINRTLDRDCSRGLHLRLDYEEMTAEVLREYYHPSRVVAAAMGGVQTLGNGNKLIAWGFQPSITEHTAEGRVVMSLQLGPLVNDGQGKGGGKGPQVYRAKKVKWVGRPGWGPSIAGYPRGSERGVYLSWNGATEVAGWAVVSTYLAYLLIYPTTSKKRQILTRENTIARRQLPLQPKRPRESPLAPCARRLRNLCPARGLATLRARRRR